jgi:hypothetical protein
LRSLFGNIFHQSTRYSAASTSSLGVTEERPQSHGQLVALSRPRAGERDELTSGTSLRSQWWIRSSRSKRKMFAVAEAAARTTPHLGLESCCSLCREVPSGDTMHHLSCGDLRCPSGRFEAVQAARSDGLLCVVQRSTRSAVRKFDLGFRGTDLPVTSGTCDRSYSLRAIRACSEAVSAEGSHEACAFAQVRSAPHMESREDVQKLLLRARHDPAQVIPVRRLASVRRIHARELRGRDSRGVRDSSRTAGRPGRWRHQGERVTDGTSPWRHYDGRLTMAAGAAVYGDQGAVESIPVSFRG